MKRIVYLLATLLICVSNLSAQTNGTSENEPTNDGLYRFLENFQETRLSYFQGKPAIQLYEYLVKNGFRIKHVSTISSNNWPRGEEKDYMLGVVLYNQSSNDIDKGKEFIELEIYLDINIETSVFWRALPTKGWASEILNRTKDKKVLTIKFEKMRI